ncbi:MAG: sugar phosphate isomerase/epimerase [Acidobacteriaceae bacterium]|nr:sugar phosphate isomerase/epimerase [Acidobacteriaceae bacterium]
MMIDRRGFTKQLCLAMIASRARAGSGDRKQRISIGAQTNTWGVPITPYEHLLDIVDTLARIGYEGFETNYKALSEHADKPAECRRDFEARHCPLIAAHNGVRFDDKDKINAEIEGQKKIAATTAKMGATYMIVSGRRLPHVDGKLDVDAAHRKMEALNRLGRTCREEGLKLCYHNHVQEFEDDPSEISLFFKETDPAVVALNYDVGNANGVQPDAGTFSEEHFRRIAIYHIKDVKRPEHATSGPRTGENGNIPMDLGKGQINLKGVVAPLLDSDWKGWLTVEREGQYPHPAEHPEALLRQCRDYLRQITGV